jgi:hypothetical protein
MRLFRRRPAEGLIDDERPEVADAIAATVVDDVDVVRARLDALDRRIALLEARFADADEAAIVLPDQTDVLDAQVRSARIAADLHLVAIELRSELQRLRGDWPQAVDLADRLAEVSAADR